MDKSSPTKINTVVFDLGNVLINWNPRNLFSKMFTDADQMEYFLENVCTMAWNEEQDAGRPFQQAVDMLLEQFPDYAEFIIAYDKRWEETMGSAIQGTVDILKTIKESDLSVYGLTNFSNEKFPIAQQRFDFLSWFDGILVSGDVKIKKPDPIIYHALFNKFDIDPTSAVFIDDSLQNVEASIQLGMRAIHFTSPKQLKVELKQLAVI